jgi:hypothetical protein
MTIRSPRSLFQQHDLLGKRRITCGESAEVFTLLQMSAHVMERWRQPWGLKSVKLFLLAWWWRSLGCKHDSQMVDDLIYDPIVTSDPIAEPPYLC